MQLSFSTFNLPYLYLSLSLVNIEKDLSAKKLVTKNDFKQTSYISRKPEYCVQYCELIKRVVLFSSRKTIIVFVETKKKT